jgi:hypothetical protein
MKIIATTIWGAFLCVNLFALAPSRDPEVKKMTIDGGDYQKPGMREVFQAIEEGRFQEAHTQLETLAQKGDADAMVQLGVLIQEGAGVNADHTKAIEWYLKAFAKKNGEAYLKLGSMYRDGLGVPKNQKIACALFILSHINSYGGELIQSRIDETLQKQMNVLSKEEMKQTLLLCEEYVVEYLTKRDKLKDDNVPPYLVSNTARRALKDMTGWTESETKFINSLFQEELIVKESEAMRNREIRPENYVPQSYSEGPEVEVKWAKPDVAPAY